MTLLVRGALHAAALGIMTWGYLELSNTPQDEWISSQTGGHWQFLTIQGLGLAWTTTLLSLASDIFPSVAVFKSLKRALFMIAMPLAVVISSIYWSLLIFLPTLILPRNPGVREPSSSDEVEPLMRIPLSHDLSLHAVPGISMLLDFVLFESKYSPSATKYAAPFVAFVYGVFYATWVEHCGKENGVFPYPFLTENPFEIRVAIYAGAVSIALISFWVLNSLKANHR